MPQTIAPHVFTNAVDSFQDQTDTPRAFLERCLESVDRLENVVQAFAAIDIDGARQAADAATKRYAGGRPLSPIDGMIIGVKDIIDTADLPTQMNSPIYTGHQPSSDAACVTAIRRGGGIILGKTVTTEFAISRSGPTTNPFDHNRTPGGSSSGSAAAAGSGMIAAGFGTQTQGSIIRPASYCGAAGFKPTLGALSTDGVHPLSRSHDHLGTIASGVRDAWRLAKSTADDHPGHGSTGLDGPAHAGLAAAPPARLGVLRLDGFAELDDAAGSAFETALGILDQAGADIVEPQSDPRLARATAVMNTIFEPSINMLARDMRWPFEAYRARHPDGLGPRIVELLDKAATTTIDDYRGWLSERTHAQSLVSELAGEFDALVFPASSGVAPIGLVQTGSRTFLAGWTFLGFPTFSIPGMRVGGLPFGLQLAGFANRDYRLACHAAWVEDRLHDYRDRWT